MILNYFKNSTALRMVLCGALLGQQTISALRGQEALPAYSESASVAWWKSRSADTSWPEEAEKLRAVLERASQGADFEKLSQDARFLGWFELQLWLSWFPKITAGEFFSTPAGRASFSAVAQNTHLRRAFFLHLTTLDDAPRACEILCRLWAEQPALVQKLPQLAVAFALVWDQEFPATWPHPQVRPEALARGNAQVSERLQWFHKAWAEKRYLVDPARLQSRDLMFVIDTPLELRELDYGSQKAFNLKDPKRLNDLFTIVPYDFARMQRGEMVWQPGTYRLVDIGKAGGICSDQAFFVSQVGKAHGIPTVLLLGQGTSGGHAWVGYADGPGAWNLEVGRYREHKYVAGSTWDPQTWRRITDAQLKFTARDSSQPGQILRGRLLTQWAKLHADAPNYPQLLGIARQAWSKNLDIWLLQAACVQDRELPAAAQGAFWNAWITAFKEDRDMRFQGQSRLLALLEKDGNTKAAEALRQQITLENKGSRFDLAIHLAAGPVLEKAQLGDWKTASALYEKALETYKKTAGGDLFYSLVQPFVEKAAATGEMDVARQAVAKAKPIFQIVEFSTLAVDFKNLEKMLGIK